MVFQAKHGFHSPDTMSEGDQIEKYCDDLRETAKEGIWPKYIRVVQEFDRYMSQYKDRKYWEDIKDLPNVELVNKMVIIRTKDQAQSVEIHQGLCVIIMGLLNRAGFTKTRLYDGELEIDIVEESKLKGKEEP